VDRVPDAAVDRRERDEGFSIVEVAVACTIFAIALMTTGLTLLHGARSGNESEDFTVALRSIRDVCAEIQEQANEPQNLPAFQGIGSIYASRHNTTRAIPELPGGSISIVCYANEATVPTILGGPQDLNFDGDSQDNHGGQANGSDLNIVPAEITISFTDERGTVTQTFHRRFTQTTD
jgi:type II secretory pathway pseudopilin PulG